MEVESGVNAVLGVGGLGAIAWGVYERWQRNQVQNASNESNIAVSDANKALFDMLTQRLTSVEEEVKQLRAQLAKEREYTNRLVNVMITAGLQIPPHDI